MRGQSAVEYLIITGFLLVITGIIFAYSLFIYSDSVSSSTANTAVNSILNTVDQVYALGQGSTLFVSVDIPQNIADVELIDLPQDCDAESGECRQTALILDLQTSAGISQIGKSARGLFELDFDLTHSTNGVTGQALKQQGHYSLKISWERGQKRINICLHTETGECVSNE